MSIGLCQYTANPPGNDKEGAVTLEASKSGSKPMSTAEAKEQTFSPLEEGGGTDTSARPQLSSNEPAGSSSLEKIREILFGSQMQEFQQRCDRLEERLVKIAMDLREDLKKSLDSLESSLRSELESWNNRFTAEQNERVGAVKGLSQELKELEESSKKLPSQLEEQATKSQRERKLPRSKLRGSGSTESTRTKQASGNVSRSDLTADPRTIKKSERRNPTKIRGALGPARTGDRGAAH
jgi:hypothetical protein